MTYTFIGYIRKACLLFPKYVLLPLFKTMGIMIKIVTFNDHLVCASCFPSIIEFSPTGRHVFSLSRTRERKMLYSSQFCFW